MRLALRLITLSLLVVAAGGDLGFAQSIDNNPRFGDIWKKSQALRDIPSTNPTPIEFTFEGVEYRVPRNYLVRMDGPLTPPTFRVTYPGLKPLTEETKQCLTQPRAYWPPGCAPIEFWLEGHQPLTADDDHFNNARKLFHSQTAKQGPNGFQMYETGPEDARIETYRKKTPGHTLLFDCMIFTGDHGKRDAVCSNYFSPLPNGNALSYRLDLDQIKDAENIDDGIRALIDSFTLTKKETK